MKRLFTFLTLCAATVSTSASAPEFAPIGVFQDVRRSAGEQHCYGWSLQLWEYKGQLLGLLDQHQGLCGDPACEVLRDVSHDPRTGHLSFSAFQMRFVGSMQTTAVTGTLGTEHLRLKQHDDRLQVRSDESIGAWCDFWRRVPRCTGVAELCQAVGVHQQ